MATPTHTSPWYSIQRATPVALAVAQAANTPQADAEIFIYGDIGESWFEETTTAASFVADLGQLNAQAITVRIGSYGGSVPDGLGIYNAIRRHPATITTVVDSVAMSIASLIAVAGDRVEISANAILMVHAPHTGSGGNSAEHRATADMLDQFAGAMATSYAAKTGRPVAEMLALLTDGKDHYYTASEALQAGFVDAIVADRVDLQDPAQQTLPNARASAQTIVASARARYPSFPRPTPAAQLQNSVQANGAPVASATSQPQEATMPQNSPAAVQLTANPTATTVAAAAPVQAAAIAAALAADQQRRESIRAAFKPFASTTGVPEVLAACEGDHNITVESASARLLAHLGMGVTPIAGHVSVRTVEDERDKHLAAAEQAIMARAGLRDAKGPIRADSANPYRGQTLLRLAESCLARGGVRTTGMERMDLVAAAFTQSSSDFPVLLENVMHKTLLGAYALQADTWTRFCARGTVSDFRAHNRFRTGSLSSLDSLNELGEYRNKPIPDGEKVSVSIGTKGNIINISRQTVINDDMGALTGLSADLGRAAKRTIEQMVYATLLENSGMGPTMADGKTLFHADHGNVTTGVPSVTSFDDARLAMSRQKDISGHDFLAITPSIWLGSDGVVNLAKLVNNSVYDPDATNKLQRPNVVSGQYADLVGSPRLSGAPWWSFAAPSEAPVIEVDFLDGNDLPYLELQNGFDVDGARWKVRLDVGVNAIDYRGAVRSTGA